MLALTLGLTAALCWGLHDLLVRRVTPGAEVMGQIMVVLGTAALWVVPVGLWLGDWRGLGLAAPVAAASGASYVLGCLGLYKAFSLAPVRLVAPVLGSFPLISLGLAAAEGRAVGLGDWLAAGAVVAGISLVAVLGAREQTGPGRAGVALLWAFGGACGFAATFALGQIATRQADPLATIAITRGAAFAVIAALVRARRVPLAPVRVHLPLLIGMGTLDACALALVNASGRLPHAEYAAVSSSLFGVVTVLLARFVLGERVQPGQWLGIGVIFAGIARLSLG